MEIQVEIIAVEVINKGKYKVAEVTYKQDGRTGTKKVMSFGAQEQAFKFMSSDKVKKGDVYTVEINKNGDNYWDWTKVKLGPSEGTIIEGEAKRGGNAAPNRGNYETPEERAARQVYIIRQSSITNAINHLNHVKKAYEVQEIFSLAAAFEEYVLGKEIKKLDPVAAVTGMEDDIPY